MTVALWEMVLLMIATFVVCVSCFSLGAYVVFKTKRESYEPLFGKAVEGGDAVVLDDFPGGSNALDDDEQADAAAALMGKFEEQNVRFLSQMAKERQQGVPNG